MAKAADMVVKLNGGSDTCFAEMLRETGDDLARATCGIDGPYGRSDELDELRERVRVEAERRAEEWFAKHGQAAVFFGRLLPVVRTFISLPAGVAEMPLAPFVVYTTAGCLPWTFALAAVGYVLGGRWTTVDKYFKPITYGLAVLVVGAIAWWLIKRYRERKAEQTSVR